MDAQRPQKAMLGYEKALLWRELFELAQLQKVDQEEIVAMAYRVAGMHIFLPRLAMLVLTIA
jgi:elongator complex protein 1